MKKGLSKKSRIVMMSITIVLMGIILFLLYREVKLPRYKEEKIPTYSYVNKNNIDYKILLKPNVLYEQESLGKGETYITEFIDYVQASFDYQFTGERKADIKGEYEVIAEIEGYAIEKEKEESIWKKKFILLPKKSIEVEDKGMMIKEDISFRLDEYTNFAKLVMENSKVNSSSRLIVKMNINTNIATDKGTIEEKLSPSIVIPLNTGYFTITGNLQEEKPGAIEETKQVQIPANKKIMILYASILIVLFMGLLLLVLFTKEITIDPFEKKLKKIFKKHGDRMVALNSEIAVSCEYYSQVKSMDDLVRIADEIGKPIMYTYNSDYKQISKFYVVDKDYMYTLNLNDSPNQAEVCEVSNAKE